MRDAKMRKSYDFSKSVRNPYARRMKKQITIRVDETAIAYFKAMAEERGIPYQSLMNWYLVECATDKRRPKWA
jgi:predicted DNA binding CopG/RHH family protein